MDFLNTYGFEKQSIESLEKCIPLVLKNELYKNSNLVGNNINYLKEYGINNYEEVFKKYPEMFLMDNNLFEGIFSKYDKADTIDKVSNNVIIVEYL